jgi:hypothetical protein
LRSFFNRGEIEFGFVDMIDQKSFQIADGDRPVLFDPFTFPFAGMGTDIGKDSRKRKFLSHQGKGLFEFPLRDEGNITLGITMERAGGCTGRRSASIHGVFEGNSLRKGNIDRLPHPDAHIEFIGKGNRTLTDTVSTGSTFGHIDIAGFFPDRDLEISGLPLDTDNFRIGEEVDIGVVGRINHLRRDDAS